MPNYTQHEIDLAKQKFTYEPSEGILLLKDGRRAGWVESDGYRRVWLGANFLAHIVVWALMTGEWPAFEIDHKNTIKDDNTWDNLRPSTRLLNLQNQHTAHKNNKLGILGVSLKHGKFIARIQVNKKPIALGAFNTAEEARLAYRNAKTQFHPEAMEL